jgi:hypothetical protein
VTLEELRRRMTYRELRLWIEAYGVEPWGEDRADLRAGIIASTTANCHRSKGKPFRPSDFIPTFTPQRDRPQTEAEMQAAVRKFNALMGGKFSRKQR